MPRFLPSFALFPVAFLSLMTGCATHRAQDRLLAPHPIHETRMSTRQEDGYMPSGVWRIRGEHCTLYLAGTSHVLPEGEVPFPSPFYAAYRDSKIIYIEFDTDMSFLMTLRLVPRVMKLMKSHEKSMVPPKDKTLADYLSRDTLEEVRARYGKDYSRAHLTPVGLLFMIGAGAAEGNGPQSGVEEPFRLLARRDHKPLRQLDGKEVIDTAFLVMEQMIVESERDVARLGADAAVRKVLLEQKDLEQSSWRHGELNLVMQEMEEFKTDSPELYEKLLPERNRRWIRELEKVLRGKKNTFVLVGVAHLGGEEGLLSLLRKAGYTPEQLYGVDRPEFTPRR